MLFDASIGSFGAKSSWLYKDPSDLVSKSLIWAWHGACSLYSVMKILLFLTLLVACSKAKQEEAASSPWIAAEREVPPLQLDYHGQLKRLPQGEDMLRRLCFLVDREQLANYDKVRQTFCQQNPPSITSLEDLQNVLSLRIPPGLSPEMNGVLGVSPGWALTGHSTSLVSRFVSPINPRVILFTPVNTDGVLAEDFVAMGFVRGDQFVELVSREPKSGELKFFLFAFEQDCNDQGHCSIDDLQSEKVEKNWLRFTIYEDKFLGNTVFDCTHCHQSKGYREAKVLRMQELNAPFLHFFSPNEFGKELVEEFRDFHGETVGLGGIPSEMIPYSSPEKLSRFMAAAGFSEQENSFDSKLISEEAVGGQPGKTWLEGWSLFKTGEVIPFPSWRNNILDDEKTAAIKTTWQSADKNLRMDLRLSIDDSLGPSMGTRAPLGLSDQELLDLACRRCHNERLDPNLGKSSFNSHLEFTDKSKAKIAIDRMLLLKDDPASSLAMPPRMFMDLSDEEIDRLIEFLREEKDL